MGMIQEFKEFALKGNFFDMAIGVVIGGAFGKIVSSMIEDIIMPVVGLAGKVDFSKAVFTLREATVGADGKVITDAINLRYGNFITIFINFLILAFVLFLVVKAYNTAKKRFEAEKPAAAPAGPTKDQQLLSDILAELKKR